MNKATSVATPLPAASLILVRDGQAELEVLMMERAQTMRFAPGAFVFPGGKVDKQDQDAGLWKGLTNSDSISADLPYRVAALRELYEETSVFLTCAPTRKPRSNLSFRERLAAEGAQLNIANMVPFAHWVTPEPMPRRFDTHFYIAAHNGDEAVQDGNEAVSLAWVNPRKLLQNWENDEIPLMFPTRLNLMKLARAASVAEALAQAAAAKVVRTLPVVGQDENGIKLTIDPATGYAVTRASAKEIGVETSR